MLAHRPTTNLRLIQFDHPLEMSQLRVPLKTLLGRLAHSGRHVPSLELFHEDIPVPCLTGFIDESVEGILVLHTPSQRRESLVSGSRPEVQNVYQVLPMVLGERGNCNPAINALGPVGPMRSGLLVRRTITVPRPLTPVHRVVEDGRTREVQTRFTLGSIDMAPLTGHVTPVPR